MTLLWLDDCRNPKFNVTFDGNIVWVKSYDEFDAWIQANGLPDKISFDYSLADFDHDGIDCVKAIIRYCDNNEGSVFPRYAIHSEHPQVYKLREYISHSIEMYELGEAIEEDRKPDTADQIEALKERDKQRQGKRVGPIFGGSTNERYVDAEKYDNSNELPMYQKGVTIVNSNKIGRNDACKCGSGKKYKKCCL